MTNQQVTVLEEHQGQSQSNALLSVIERVANSPDADVDKLERMLAMQERVLERNAQQAFGEAMALMQADLPVIERNGEIAVNGVVRSNYAKFEDINKAMLPVMQKHGFAINFSVEQDDQYIKIIGTLRHREGHRESTSLKLPADTTGSKNAVQSIGSSVSYGKRYVMCALLNISTTDEDDDGVKAAPSIDLFAHNMVVQNHFDLIHDVKMALGEDDIETARGMLNDLTDEEKHAVWVAPTKGGIFTTEERRKLKEGK